MLAYRSVFGGSTAQSASATDLALCPTPDASPSASAVDVAAATGQRPMSSGRDNDHPLRHAGAGRFWRPDDEQRRRPFFARPSRLRARSNPPPPERQPSPPPALPPYSRHASTTLPPTRPPPAIPSAIPPPAAPPPPVPTQAQAPPSVSPPPYSPASRRSNGSSFTLPSPPLSASASWVASEPRRIARGLSTQERAVKARFHLARLQEVEDARLANIEDGGNSSAHGSSSPPTRHTSGSSAASRAVPDGLRLSYEAPGTELDMGGLLGPGPPRARARSGSTESSWQAVASTTELPGADVPEPPEAEQLDLAGEMDPAVTERDPEGPASPTIPFIGMTLDGRRMTEPAARRSRSPSVPPPASADAPRSQSESGPAAAPASAPDDEDDSLFTSLNALKARLSQQPGARQPPAQGWESRFRAQALELAAARGRHSVQGGGAAELDGALPGLGGGRHRHTPSVESLASAPEFRHTVTPPMPAARAELSTSASVAARPGARRPNRLSRMSRISIEAAGGAPTTPPASASSGASSPFGAASGPASPRPHHRRSASAQHRASSCIPVEPPAFSIDIEPDIDPRTGRPYVPQVASRVASWSNSQR